MKKTILLFILIISIYNLKADNYPTGANSLGMANATVATPSLWSVYHNQAALAFVDGFNVGIYYENKFNFQAMSVKALALSYNTKPGTFGFSYSNFGFSKFSENKIGFSYSLKIAKNVAMGIQLDYLLINQDSYYGNISTFTGEIGIYARPFDNFHIGAHIFNPWRTKIAQYQDERLATIFRLGMGYDFSDELTISFETEKNIDMPVLIKSGVEFEPIENIFLRAGIGFSEKNSFPAFGFGYNLQNFDISIAFESHPILGFKSGISLNYRFN